MGQSHALALSPPGPEDPLRRPHPLLTFTNQPDPTHRRSDSLRRQPAPQRRRPGIEAGAHTIQAWSLCDHRAASPPSSPTAPHIPRRDTLEPQPVAPAQPQPSRQLPFSCHGRQGKAARADRSAHRRTGTETLRLSCHVSHRVPAAESARPRSVHAFRVRIVAGPAFARKGSRRPPAAREPAGAVSG